MYKLEDFNLDNPDEVGFNARKLTSWATLSSLVKHVFHLSSIVLVFGQQQETLQIHSKVLKITVLIWERKTKSNITHQSHYEKLV